MSDDFRSRARAVRMQTRAHLAQLRAARRTNAPAPAAASHAAPADAEVAPEFLVSSDAVMASSAPAPEDVANDAPALDSAPDTEVAAEPALENAPEAAPVMMDEPETAALDSVPVDEATEAEAPIPSVDEAPASEAPADTAPSDADALAAALASAGEPVADSDLAKLPGIGPGLIWFFQQRGIQSLADLAQADAAQLRSEIGFIGSLVDFEGWTAFARDNA